MGVWTSSQDICRLLVITQKINLKALSDTMKVDACHCVFCEAGLFQQILSTWWFEPKWRKVRSTWILAMLSQDASSKFRDPLQITWFRKSWEGEDPLIHSKETNLEEDLLDGLDPITANRRSLRHGKKHFMANWPANFHHFSSNFLMVELQCRKHWNTADHSSNVFEKSTAITKHRTAWAWAKQLGSCPGFIWIVV